MKIFNKLFVLGSCVLALSSCLGDLNTLPLNETDFTSETAYDSEASYLNALSYINGYYMLVGQDDPGSNDLGFSDSGQSEFIRQWGNLNEMSCDALKCVWGDSYITDLSYNSWGNGTNDAITCVYTRALKGITLVNEFLLQTTDAKLEGRGQSSLKEAVAGYRAEARFHRALFFYVLMDEFGNPPFPTPENIGGENPSQISRADLFAWLEEELLELASDESAMPAYGAVPYPRPTKGSAWALLSRMYLNAEVYTGTARWSDAKSASKKVIEMGYSLAGNYQDLFLQDNTSNGSASEFIFAVAYDKDNCQSWGGTTTLTSASLSEDANKKLAEALEVPNAQKINYENWAGYHVPDEYVANFELQDVVWGSDDAFGFDRSRSDKRALVTNFGAVQTFDYSSQASGWLCWKFCGLNSDGTCAQTDADTYPKFSSADFPVLRLAEMYLNYAEADARLNGGDVTDADAKEYVKALRDRAGVNTPATIDLDFLLKERAREFMWEGHRRVDLIRYGYFTSMNFAWPFKGGVESGKVSIPEFRTIYPIIQSDLSSNSNLTQNQGY